MSYFLLGMNLNILVLHCEQKPVAALRSELPLPFIVISFSSFISLSSLHRIHLPLVAIIIKKLKLFAEVETTFLISFAIIAYLRPKSQFLRVFARAISRISTVRWLQNYSCCPDAGSASIEDPRFL